MFGLFRNSGPAVDMNRALARIERLGGTKRFWELDKLERYYLGTQHDGKGNWWNDDLPARERKPVVLSRLPKAVVEQTILFTLGEGKFPDVRFQGSEDPRSFGGVSIPLSVEDAQVLDALWAEIVEQIRLKINFREMARRGLSMRTACGVYSLRDGELNIELCNAKNCKVEWADYRKRQPSRLECKYIFPREERQPDGTIKDVWYWYRRVVTETQDLVYNEAPVGSGDEPDWTIDPDRSFDHNTGFCPAFWFANLPRLDVQDEDGVALIDGCEDEIDAIDYALSVRHTGAFVYGSPQGFQTGVVSGSGPDAGGRVAVDYFTTPDGSTVGYADMSGNAGPARKRSPFDIWSFEEPDVKVGLLESNGGAAKMVTDHLNDLRSRLLESIQVVLVDPASVAGRSDMSAKLLELLYAPLLALVDDLRECWGVHLKTLVSSLLRFLLVHASADSRSVFLPGIDAALPILARFALPSAEGSTRWIMPPCTLGWGDHFTPTMQDIKDAVTIAKGVRGGKTDGEGGTGDPLVTKRTALRFIAQYFDVDDLDAELDALEEESETAKQESLEHQANTLDIQAKHAPSPAEKPDE